MEAEYEGRIHDRKKRHRIWNVSILFFLGIILLFMTCNYRNIPLGRNRIDAWFTGQGITGEEAEILQNYCKTGTDPIELVAWNDRGNEQICSTDLEKYASAQVIGICGNSEYLFPENAALWYEEKNACLVSEDIAFEIFGTIDIIGLNLMIGDEIYKIAGVMEKEKNTVVMEENSKLAYYNCITILKENNVSSKQMLETIQLLYRIEKNIDYEYMFFEMGLEIKLVVGLIFIIIYNTILTEVRCNIHENKRTLVIVKVFGVAIFFVWIWLIRENMDIPIDMIPDKWSDFSFWSDWWAELLEQRRWFDKMQKTDYLLDIWKTLYIGNIAVRCSFILGIITIYNTFSLLKQK